MSPEQLQPKQCVRLPASLHVKKFRCYEVKPEESEKASSRWKLNPGHFWVDPPVLWSGCHGSVAEYGHLKPEVSWVQLPVTAGLFTFYPITSKFLYFQCEARCSKHSD